VPEAELANLPEIFRSRALKEGGFVHRAGGSYRPDATAWAVLALTVINQEPDLVEAARARLAADQQRDGRVSVSPQCPEAFWPTPLAALAWQGAPAYQSQHSRALNFLLATTGLHWQPQGQLPFAHDPSIQGWPWTAHTHSWVEPTSLAMMALKVAGLGDHERVKEGARMLLDRQLPKGGWNYGNTRVFDQELHPAPEYTGVALNALQGLKPREELKKSLEFLKSQVQGLRTPLSLGWALLGLGAWGERPAAADAWIAECLARQAQYGSYDTTLLALLVVSRGRPEGLESVFAQGGRA
jgi:hypothetical protein